MQEFHQDPEHVASADFLTETYPNTQRTSAQTACMAKARKGPRNKIWCTENISRKVVFSGHYDHADFKKTYTLKL